MDQAQQSQPSGEREDGVKRLLNRMRALLKRLRRRRKDKAGQTSEATSSTAAAVPAATSATATSAAQSQPKSTPIEADTQATTTSDAPPPPTGVRIQFRSDEQREKTKALFAKYGLQFQDEDWIVSSIEPTSRIEKPIRMRVRRHCHNCKAMFGTGKICPKCEHEYCSQCTRYPKKKKKSGSRAAPTGTGQEGITGTATTGAQAPTTEPTATTTVS